MEYLVDQNKDLKEYLLPDWEPVEFHQDRGDMVMLLGAGNESH